MTNETTPLIAIPVETPPILDATSVLAAQKFAPAVAAGFSAAVAGAVAWAVVTVMTGYQLGIVSVAIGALIGYAMRQVGHGVDKKYGIVAALLALFGSALGGALCVVPFLARQAGVSYGEYLAHADIAALINGYVRSLQAMDLLFYAIAAHQAYRMSFKYVLTPAKKQPSA